ncbi:MAG: LacI family DNA-binding transcriptional regulator [Planctomycetota bacterium]
MSSIREVAESAGVSVATVSRAFNNLPDVAEPTRVRVFAEADRLGYDPEARRRKAVLVGLAYPGSPVNAEFGGFDAAIVSGVLRGVEERKFDVVLLDIARDKRRGETYTQFFRRKGTAGVVLRSFAESRGICEEIANEGFPHIVVADRFENKAVNFIRNDSYQDTLTAMEHLASLGHRRVAMCVHMVDDSDHADRRRAYHQGVATYGLDQDPELVYEDIADMNGGAKAINRLMSLPKPPTALLITDPLASIGALRRCLEVSIDVPSELSVVGFDDSNVRHMAYPVYTAVYQDAVALGHDAAEWLTRRVMRKTDSSCRLVKRTSFEVNQTTAPPPPEPIRVMPGGQRVKTVFRSNR